VDSHTPDPQFDAVTAHLLRREALRRAAEELNTTSGPGLEDALARISAEVTAEAVYQYTTAAGKTAPGVTDAAPHETIYLVQAFKAGIGMRLDDETPIRCKSSDSARGRAENLATTKAGVVAFATSGDAELGDYDEEPTIIFKAGRLPAPFEEA
jgi:hypothetical protein